jgi:prepilin-type processing-associated H-X9-DG protein
MAIDPALMEEGVTPEAADPSAGATPSSDDAPPIDEQPKVDAPSSAEQPADQATADAASTREPVATPSESDPLAFEVAAEGSPAPPPAPQATMSAEGPFDELGNLVELKADANGLYPHSRKGGNPATPLMGGGFSSRHADGVNIALGDGSVRFVSESATAGFLGRLANRADGKTIDANEW